MPLIVTPFVDDVDSVRPERPNILVSIAVIQPLIKTDADAIRIFGNLQSGPVQSEEKASRHRGGRKATQSELQPGSG